MSGDVITLDGLETVKLAGTSDSCGRLVSIQSPTLGQSVQVCEADVKRIAGGLQGIEGPQQVTRPKRKVGRPKGATVLAGAKRPAVKQCTTTNTIVTKKGRQVCKCADQGNKQILPNKRCGL